MSNVFHPTVVAILTRLWWDESSLIRGGRRIANRNKTEPSFIAMGPTRGRRQYDPEVVQLYCDHPDATGLDEIPSKIFDCRESGFEKQVFFWVTKATFDLQGIRAKYAERDRLRVLRDRRITDETARLRGDIKKADWDDCARVIFSCEGEVEMVGTHYHWNILNKPPGDTPEKQAEAVRRVIRFLRCEGWDGA